MPEEKSLVIDTDFDSNHEVITIGKESLGVRLDKFLAEHFPQYSRTYFQFLIEEEAVFLNGIPVKKQFRLEEGDQIHIFFQLPSRLDVKPEKIPLDVLYEDEAILVVNKPAGMVIHPAPGSPSGTFANALLYHCEELKSEEYPSLRPGIVHRLDKDTSGVLIAAKTLRAHQNLIEQFSSRTPSKIYLAITCGVPKEGEYVAPIKRHPVRRKEMTISSDGKHATTHFKILARRKGLSFIEAKLDTGRTHQIRIHLKSLHAPILGDPVYGSSNLNKEYQASRQMLHAHQLMISHPLSGDLLHFEAPIPQDMKNFIDLILQA